MYVPLVRHIQQAAGVVQTHVPPGGSFGYTLWATRTFEGADFLNVIVVVDNPPVGGLPNADEGYAADDGVGGRPLNDGLLNIETILGVDNGRLSRCYGLLNDVCRMEEPGGPSWL